MQQKDIIKYLADNAHQENVLIVSEMGSQTMWLHSVCDHDSHLYLSGPMSMSPSVALGVALANPDKTVMVICGDGSLTMNLGGLTTIAHQQPKNLIVVVIDNGIYELTGSVATPSQAVDWQKLALSLKGFSYQSIDTSSTLDFSKDNGLRLWHAVVKPSTEKAPSFPLKPVFIHQRFKDYLFASRK